MSECEESVDDGGGDGRNEKTPNALRISGGISTDIESPFRRLSLGEKLRRSNSHIRTASDVSDTEKSLQTQHTLLHLLTINAKELYQTCKRRTEFGRDGHPRYVLTFPPERILHGGIDNMEHNLVICRNDTIDSPDGEEFVVVDLLGEGTYGQVVKCLWVKNSRPVALKIVKNHPSYTEQAMNEVRVLHMMNQFYDEDHHIVRMLCAFIYKEHLCISFEELGLNLYELLKKTSHRGLSLNTVRHFTRQVLDAVSVLRECGVIHTDIKPENILLTLQPKQGSLCLKLVDFGSATFIGEHSYPYVQSRYYRAPEVILGSDYGCEIDMWSLGCLSAELFLGVPLLPGASNYDQIKRTVSMLGCPPVEVVQSSDNGMKYFEWVPRKKKRSPMSVRIKSVEEYMKNFPDEGKVERRKSYFNYDTLEDIIMNSKYPDGSELSVDDAEKEGLERKIFVDFLKGVLCVDPEQRWTPLQAISHPFFTGQPFDEPFVPDESLKQPSFVAVPQIDIQLSSQVRMNASPFGTPVGHQLLIPYNESIPSSPQVTGMFDWNSGVIFDPSTSSWIFSPPQFIPYYPSSVPPSSPFYSTVGSPISSSVPRCLPSQIPVRPSRRYRPMYSFRRNDGIPIPHANGIPIPQGTGSGIPLPVPSSSIPIPQPTGYVYRAGNGFARPVPWRSRTDKSVQFLDAPKGSASEKPPRHRRGRPRRSTWHATYPSDDTTDSDSSASWDLNFPNG